MKHSKFIFAVLSLMFAFCEGSFAGEVQWDCVGGHEKEFENSVYQMIISGMTTVVQHAGADVDPSSIQIQLYRDGGIFSFVGGSVYGGTFRSTSGTKFLVRFHAPIDINTPYAFQAVYRGVGHADGFDSLGNPINGHCTLKLTHIDNYSGVEMLVENDDTGILVGKTPLEKQFQLY